VVNNRLPASIHIKATPKGVAFFILRNFRKIKWPMDKTEKLLEKRQLMEKMLRELEDISNSQTSLLKKVAKLEADNINLGNTLLEKRLPDIHEKIDSSVTEANKLQEEFSSALNKFVEDNKLNDIPAV
jgi:hypothetical protein